MKDLFSLQGKRILITGAGQGIGFVMAQGLAQYGAEIIINDISETRANDAVMKLRDEGATAYPAVFNVTDADSVENAISRIEKEMAPSTYYLITPVFSAAILLPNFRFRNGMTLFPSIRRRYF
jgi:NAD(P)-dependent dehydrogenase (short-subunit alcohol dehydrogenase family)